jgi:FKBP-type peptidyl-prolyl cis-trans isomerase FklB
MKKIIIAAAVLTAGLSQTAFAQKTATKTTTKSTTTKSATSKTTTKKPMTTETNLNNEVDKLSYSLGLSIATNMKGQGFDTINIAALTKAFNDVYKGAAPLLSEQDANNTIQAFMQKAQAEKGGKNVAEGKAFLEANKSKPGVITLPSGLQYQVITEGTGPKPLATDKVTTHYHGTLIDGTVFDSSVDRGQPATFPVNGVIQGWVEALQLMPTGSKWRLFVPSNLAYGERGAGGSIGPNTTLIFDVELISIDK